MRAASATEADAPALQAFNCVRFGEDFEHEVQEWCRAGALEWLRTAPDARLFLFYDEDDALIAVSGHEAFELPLYGRFIPALAVSAAVQGRGIGRTILFSIYQQAAALTPGGILVFRVHPRNVASLRMCEKLGWVEWTAPPDFQPYLEFEMDLP